MGPADWVVIGLWLTAIAFMVIMAWEPWRETRKMASIDLSDDLISRPVNPFYVLVLPVLVAVAPFFAQFVPRAGGENPWRHPHLLSPTGPVALTLIVALQAYICSRILRVVRLHREAVEAKRQTFEKGAKPSS